MAKLINLTPHDIVVCIPDTTEFVLPKSDNPARVESIPEVTGHIRPDQTPDHRIPIHEVRYGGIQNLPPRAFATYYVVSRMVKDRIPEREDCVVPADLLRDAKGNIIGCMAFAR